MSEALREYEARLDPARRHFAADQTLETVMSPETDPALLELFLIQFCSLGVGMTEPVEGWIRRAGERCEAMGLRDLGRSLKQHAAHEAGHHLMMIEDTKKLVARWNARRSPSLDAEELLGQPLSPGVLRYRELHEDVVGGESPFGQLAIEFEIENLSVVHGARFLQHCARRLGGDVVAGLSFLEEHVALDVGHTKFNARELGKLLQAHPGFLEALAAAGSAALQAYAQFLADCGVRARERTQRPA